jgi:hypothetical protein
MNIKLPVPLLPAAASSSGSVVFVVAVLAGLALYAQSQAKKDPSKK